MVADEKILTTSCRRATGAFRLLTEVKMNVMTIEICFVFIHDSTNFQSYFPFSILRIISHAQHYYLYYEVPRRVDLNKSHICNIRYFMGTIC